MIIQNSQGRGKTFTAENPFLTGCFHGKKMGENTVGMSGLFREF
jgi:hypothetical protein